MQWKQKFTFILGEYIPPSPPQKKSTLNSCIFILKLMNSDNSEHYFYIVCKCLSSIIYYDFYMHKVDCFFISKLIVNQSKSMYIVSRSSVIMFISQNLIFTFEMLY